MTGFHCLRTKTLCLVFFFYFCVLPVNTFRVHCSITQLALWLPVAAVHRGVAGEADGEGDTGRCHHQGRLREQHFTSLRNFESQTDSDFCLFLFGYKGAQLIDNCYFQGAKWKVFFPGYEPREASKSGGELQISRTRILREDNSALLSLELPSPPHNRAIVTISLSSLSLFSLCSKWTDMSTW
jgi:hypothetical protein